MTTVHHTDVEIAVRATEVASELIRSAYLAPVTRYAKEGDDFATQTDLAAERAILGVLAEARPGDRFLGEESGFTGAAGADRTWLIDPLCGTRNFAVGTPSVAVNVALRTGSAVTAAAVGAPFADEVLWTDGEGAFARRDGVDQRLRPEADNRLVDVDLDGPFPWSTPARLLDAPAFAEAFHPRVLSTSLALVWVAAGRRAAYVTGGDVSDSVHFAAGIAVCRAAGCVVTGLAGQPLDTAPHGLIAAADAETHARLLAAIAALR
ncbi:phosphatase [Nocardia neocaledoniensis NBRC 108232]|uniref:Myo-inositol-1(Or 4)-monophosphatase n=1 Tax=Nocardia neocaledoniensis TaxID=236511 RepID=A0A317P457_9NOCA|nr:myo-inositol-1(or 4)-monophosphatase [Nocardia neocaledoniensis]GEM32946.1 phosphatase [Nocardia neocaledoniensis NBRC 108232]